MSLKKPAIIFAISGSKSFLAGWFCFGWFCLAAAAASPGLSGNWIESSDVPPGCLVSVNFTSSSGLGLIDLPGRFSLTEISFTSSKASTIFAPSEVPCLIGVCDTRRTPFICESCLAMSSAEGMLLVPELFTSPPPIMAPISLNTPVLTRNVISIVPLPLGLTLTSVSEVMHPLVTDAARRMAASTDRRRRMGTPWSAGAGRSPEETRRRPPNGRLAQRL